MRKDESSGASRVPDKIPTTIDGVISLLKSLGVPRPAWRRLELKARKYPGLSSTNEAGVAYGLLLRAARDGWIVLSVDNTPAEPPTEQEKQQEKQQESQQWKDIFLSTR